MPVDLQWHTDGIGATFSCHGPVTGDQILQGNDELLRSPERLQQLRYGVVDLTAASSFDASVDQVRRATEQDNRIAALVPTFVVAIIAPSDLEFGMARMWEALVERPGWCTRVFRSKSDAYAWLRQELQRVFGVTMASTEP